MRIDELINVIDEISINYDLISKVEKIYGNGLPESIKKILSIDANGYFFGDNKRLLSLNEILTADEELHVNFVTLKKLPLFDVGDNDFLVYSFEDDKWELFNIVDKCSFYQSAQLEEILLM